MVRVTEGKEVSATEHTFVPFYHLIYNPFTWDPSHRNTPLLMATSKALCYTRENSSTIKNLGYLKIRKNRGKYAQRTKSYCQFF